MKFCLTSASPNEGLDEREKNKSIAAFPPLSLLYLASALKENGVEVSVLDQPGQGLTVNETVNWVMKESPDVLGFSALSTSGKTAALIISRVKEKNPNITTVIGNHYATFNAHRILKRYPSVDIIVRGEGEKTIMQLADCLKNNKPLRNVRGINYRNNQEIISTPDQPLIKDLDGLPFPDRKLINTEYHCMMAGANVAPKKFTSIISSRGCVYSCRFCSCTEIAHNIWRARSAQNTLKELELLASEGYKQLIFVDDSFTLNPKRTIEICKGMIKEKMDFQWICEGRVDNCSIELLKVMVKAGLKILYFGIENANQRILDYFNKTITPQQTETTVKTARKAGVDVIVGSFIVGAPDETRQEIQNTINFAKRLPIDLPQFNILGAHPGNDIWNEMESKGLLNIDEDWESGVAVSKICPTAVPCEEIKQMVHKAFVDHVRRPMYLLRQVEKTLGSSYRRNVVASNLTRISDIIEGTSSAT
jgi:anaerobic magnesium-protoporphyrin IX monomethyl ester cyclase